MDKNFDQIMAEYLKPVYNFVYRLSGVQDAEDITQEVFFKIWKNFTRRSLGEDGFDQQKGSLKAWIFAIARNTIIDFLRKRNNPKGIFFVFSDMFAKNRNEDGEAENDFADTIADTEPSPEEIFVQAENKKALEKLLNQLPPKYLEVILLRYQNDLTFDETGKILGKPLDTVKSLHRRGLLKLRDFCTKFP